MTTDQYLDLPYHIQLTQGEWEDGTTGWFAEVEELPGCMTQAASFSELESSIRDAMAMWIEAQLDDGRPVPFPREDRDNQYSGKFLVRIPRTLHGDLAGQAEIEGVSLNQFVTAALSAAVGWRRTRTTKARETDWAPSEWETSERQGAVHRTPEELAREFGIPREKVVRLAHEHSVPIYHGRISRLLFQEVVAGLADVTPE